MIALVFFWMALGILTALVAQSKGSNPLFWLLIGMAFGPFGLIVCFIHGRTCPFCESKINGAIRVCPKCNRDIPPPTPWRESS
ncbi:hypothetical protein JYT16_02075 [Gemmatimonas aurantiaca]|nr:hypothetical protein [Gemmatimonas aurantiaca]